MYIAPKPSGDAQKRENRFEFQVVEGGTTYSVPKLALVKPAIVAAMTAGDKNEQGRALFTLFTEYAPGALEELEDNGQLGGIYQAWVAASGVNLGESSGSSSSSFSSIGEPSTEISSSPDVPSAPATITETSAPSV